MPLLIGTAVNDGSHTPYNLVLAQGQEVVGLTTLERRVLVASECGHLVEIKKGNSLLAAAI